MTDPDERVANARSVVWRDVDGQRQAFAKFKKFRRPMRGLDMKLVADADRQYKELKRLDADIGEGPLIQLMIASIAAALRSAILVDSIRPKEQKATGYSDWAHWLWNVYSGTAHAQSWPRLLPAHYGEGTVVSSGFVGNLIEVIAVTEIGLCAVVDRSQPGTASTTKTVDETTAMSLIGR